MRDAMTLIWGTWRLCSLELKKESGEILYPFGRDVKGCVIYQRNGYMSGIISGENRPFITSPVLTGISEHERASIAKNFNAYAGRYVVTESLITHYIEVSFVPNLMAGKAHASTYDLSGDTMVLSSGLPSKEEGPFSTVYITWERIELHQ